MKQTLKSFFFLSIFTLMSSVFTDAAQAGRYELIQGEGVEVCEAYEKNLNSFNPSTPMLCERSVNPELKDFVKPAWEKLTIDQIVEINVDATDRILMLAPNSEVLKQPKSERIRKAKERSAAAPQDPLTVLRTSIDLDNNGKPEAFVKDIYESCEKRVPLPRVVLRPVGEDAVNMKILDILRSAQYREVDARHECEPYKTEGVPAANSLAVRDSLKRERCKMAMMEGVTLKESLGGFMYPDVFRYKNEWYLDVWAIKRGSSDFNVGNLHVFKHKNGKTTELCEFDFRGNSR